MLNCVCLLQDMVDMSCPFPLTPNSSFFPCLVVLSCVRLFQDVVDKPCPTPDCGSFISSILIQKPDKRPVSEGPFLCQLLCLHLLWVLSGVGFREVCVSLVFEWVWVHIIMCAFECVCVAVVKNINTCSVHHLDTDFTPLLWILFSTSFGQRFHPIMDFLWSRKAFSGPVSTPPFSSASPGRTEVRVAADQTAGQPQGGPDVAEQSRQDRQAGGAQGTEAAKESKSAAGGQPGELPITLRSRERGWQLAWPLEGGGHAS